MLYSVLEKIEVPIGGGGAVIAPCARDMKKVKSKYNDIVCVSPSVASGRIYCRAPWGETVCVDVSK